MFSLFTLFIACSSAEFDVSGAPDGADFTAVSAYWGNQFIVFLDQEIDCIDMWWVQTFNLQGEEPPTSRDLRALQITYNNDEEEIFEVANVLNQAIRRYSQFSIGAVEVDIFGDFSLHAGQTIFIDAPTTEQGEGVKKDQLSSGKYLIHQVKHVIRGGQCQTRLGLVRDSIGRKGKPHSGSMVNYNKL